MKKFLIGSGIFFIIIIGGLAFYGLYYTKTFSPQSVAQYNQNGVDLKVSYSRPYKKGRVIFGGLVPYDTIWRTGANEATVFETNKSLLIKGQPLKAGSYSLWTIPGEQTWKVIFNSEIGQWGVDFNGQANRDASKDVVSVDVPALTHGKEFEQFTISIESVGEDFELILLWDNTVVVVPISIQ
ncbi:MAG: DUF2911 domain-containing protein [Cyclobacteriaceae bacterium]